MFFCIYSELERRTGGVPVHEVATGQAVSLSRDYNNLIIR